MYERKSRRMRVQAVVMIAVLTLGLVGTAAIAQARTVTDPTWGTVSAWAQVRCIHGNWRTATSVIDIYHQEQAWLRVEARSNRLANDDLVLAFGSAHSKQHFLNHFGLQVTHIVWSQGDVVSWAAGGFPTVRDANNDDFMSLGILVHKTAQVEAGQEPDVVHHTHHRGTLRQNTIGRVGASLPAFVYDLSLGTRGVILCEHPNYGGRSLHRVSSDWNLWDDGIPTAWGSWAWLSSAIVLPATSARIYTSVSFTGYHTLLGTAAGTPRRIPDLAPVGWNDRAGSIRVTLL